MFAVAMLLAQALVAAVDVRITSLDGTTLEGSLTKFEAGELVIETTDGIQRRALSDVLEVARQSTPAELKPVTSVELLNGSRLTATSIRIADGELIVSLVKQEPLKVSLKQVRAIRFRAPNPAVDPQWLGIVEKTPAADTLVIRRSGDSLDEASGVIRSADEKTIKFDLDGDELDAPIEKLEGIVFANGAAAAGTANLSVVDVHGSRFRVRAVSGDADGNLILDLGDSRSHRFPLDQFDKIESTGSILFLASASPADRSYQSVSDVGLSPELAKSWFSPHAANDRDLLMTGNANIEFRVDEGFASLQGSAELDESVKSGGKCSLKILFDNKIVWDQPFDVTAPAVRGFDLPLEKTRRVRFELKSGTDGDVGDTLRILQPRLVK